MTNGRQPEEARLVAAGLTELLDHLGIESAHFAGRGSADLQGFASTHPERIASLTLLCPAVLDTRTLAPLAARLLVVTGDHGPGPRRVHLGRHRRRARRGHRRGNAAIPRAASGTSGGRTAGAGRRGCRH
jgi:pimeloyl-ACP methyl ester carboxylesterase